MSSSDNPQFEPQPPAGGQSQDPVVPSPSPYVPVPAGPIVAPPPVGPPPVENPVFSGWDVLALAALILVAMLVLQALVIFGAMWLSSPRASLAQVLLNPVPLIISQVLVYVAAAVIMIMLVEGKYHAPFWQAVSWKWPTAGWIFLGLGAALFVALTLVESVLPMPKDTPFEHLFRRPLDAYLLSLMAVTVAPLMEELFFHGFLYPVLARRLGVVWGIVISALAFGSVHLPQYGWALGAGLVIFLVGVACGVVRAATKSVGASVLVHAGYNGVQMLIAIVATRGFTHFEKPGLALLGWR